MRPDESDQKPLEQTPQDNGMPFDAALPAQDDTHPATDSDLDTTEVYQEGVDVASGIDTHSGNGDVATTNADEIEDEAI